MLVLVTGGSAGGKSEYAENLVPEDGERIYLATMEPFGDEAVRRIRRHRQLREGKGFDTVECPVNIVSCLEKCRGKHVLLEDLPNLVANETFSLQGNGSAGLLRQLSDLEKVSASLTCVTGILTSDGSRYDRSTMRYLADLAGIENALADRADRVVEVVCGIGNILADRIVRKTGDLSENGYEPGTEMLYEKGRKQLIFVTGPMYSGKRTYIKKALHLGDEEFERRAVWNVQDLVDRPGRENIPVEILAEELSGRDILIADELGCGVVPIDKAEREKRERAGRLSCLLAERADKVVRVVCGCPQVLKSGRREKN